MGARRGDKSARNKTDWYAATLSDGFESWIDFDKGICFGHQIIARALGSVCVPNDGKWEIGTTDMELTDIGRAVFQTNNSTMVSNPNTSSLS